VSPEGELIITGSQGINTFVEVERIELIDAAIVFEPVDMAGVEGQVEVAPHSWTVEAWFFGDAQCGFVVLPSPISEPGGAVKDRRPRQRRADRRVLDGGAGSENHRPHGEADGPSGAGIWSGAVILLSKSIGER
jgi:hypothetical protein